jgi:hypothetical protein
MQKILLAGLAAGFAIALLAPVMTTPAGAVTLEQARAECRAQFSGAGANLTSQRTGKTQSASIRECVQAKMKKK